MTTTTDVTPAEAQEIDALSDYVTVPLADEQLRVKSPSKWRPSYLRAMRQGDFDTWAEGVVHPDDLEAFIDADPTFEEINDFAAAAGNATGESLGKSPVRARSSRGSRRK